MKKRTVAIIVVLVLLAVIAGAYFMFGGVITSLFQIFTGGLDEQAVDMPALSEVVQVERGDLVDSIKVLGAVQSPVKASLSFNVSSGVVDEVFVQPGEMVSAGDPIARLDTTDLDENVTQAKKDLEDAETALKEAREPLSETDIAERRLAVLQAETRLEEAEEALEKLKETDLTTLESNLKMAEESLESAQIAHERLMRKDVQDALSSVERQYAPAINKCAELSAKTNPNTEDIHLRWLVCNESLDGQDNMARVRLARERELLQDEYSLVKATRAVDDAREALEEAQAGPDPLELAEAEHTLADARARIIQAQEALDEALAGPEARTLTAQETAVKRAQLALEYAQSELANATLTARIDGRITVVNVVAGDRVTSHTAIAEMADFEDLRIQVSVDETQVPKLFEEQPVNVILDGLPDEVFTGSVHAIPLQGTVSSGIVIYPVSTVLDEIPPGLRLGMTAEVEFILDSVEDVLLAPAAAINKLPDGTTSVTMVKTDPLNGGRIVERRYVTTGRSNGIFTEIVDGLTEGEQIEVQYEKAQSDFPF